MDSLILLAQETMPPAFSFGKILEMFGMAAVAGFCLWWMKTTHTRQVEAMERMIDRLLTDNGEDQQKYFEHVEAFTAAINNQTKAIEKLTESFHEMT